MRAQTLHQRVSWRTALVHLLLAFFGLTGLVYIFFFDPTQPGAYPTCPFNFITGMHCAGCGSLRATHNLLHGNFLEALGYNPFWVLAIPFVVYGLAGIFVDAWFGLRLPRIPAPTWWGPALLATVVLFWVVRNIPVWPLTLLAP